MTSHHQPFRSFKSSGLLSTPDSASARLPRLDENLGLEGKPLLVPIALIQDSPYQTSPLNEAKVVELMENLRKNPLSSPVVLRRGHQGRLELIAGRHRIEAYRRLGRSEIEATFRDLTDDEAERLVFYDNLFAPSMADFQKYQGFRQRRERLGLSQAQLAEEAGVSQSLVSKLLSFDGLPEVVSDALTVCPQAIGVSMAVEFVALAQASPDLAVQAIQAIATGNMTQKAAIAWLKAGGAAKPAPVKAKESKALIKSGKQKYAELMQRDNRLVIALNTADASLYTELEAWLKQRAAQHFGQPHQTEERESEAM